MDGLRLGEKLLNGPLGKPLLAAGSRLLHLDKVRAPLVRSLDRQFGARAKRATVLERQRALLYRAVLHTLDRLLSRRTLSPQVTRVVIERWSRALFRSAQRQQAVDRFQQEQGCRPPWFLAISPSHACNLACSGCYASSGACASKLPWPMLDRLMREAKELLRPCPFRDHHRTFRGWGRSIVLNQRTQPQRLCSRRHSFSRGPPMASRTPLSAKR
jgi:hypothetical protein